MAEVILFAAGIYIVVGVIFAVVFVFFFIKKIDPAVEGASVWFRLLILPGTIALWPVMSLRLVRGAAGLPVENNAHMERTK